MQSNQKIEMVFLTTAEATVAEIYEGLLGRPMSVSNRQGSQAISPYLSRFARATGNAVVPTGEPYTYRLHYA